MKKRMIALMTTGILAAGTFVGTVYANESAETKVDRKVKAENYKTGYYNKNDMLKDMIKIMKESGFKDLAKAAEKGDYEAIDKFMNNMTEDDFNKMIEMMRENGYESMANMMGSMGLDNMIKMHNAMGGAAACHGNNTNRSGMMRSF